jgi:hypothetical protein
MRFIFARKIAKNDDEFKSAKYFVAFFSICLFIVSFFECSKK